MTTPLERTRSPTVASDAAMARYRRAVDYIAAGQIYLKANPLLEERLRPEHIKDRLLGHWGTAPGINLVYAHLNRGQEKKVRQHRPYRLRERGRLLGDHGLEVDGVSWAIGAGRRRSTGAERVQNESQDLTLQTAGPNGLLKNRCGLRLGAFATRHARDLS